MKAKHLLILFLLAALAGLGAWLIALRPAGEPRPETPVMDRLVPGLADRGDRTARIEILQGGSRVDLTREGDGWRVASKGGYPADGERVRRLVTTLSELRAVEAKTARPELHDRLGVHWPDEGERDEGDFSVRPTLVRLADDGGETIAEIVLGDTSFAAGQTRQFARLLDDDRSWLVSALVEAPTDGVRWLSTRFIELERERVERVEITHPHGEVVAVGRTDSEADFAVESVPDGLRPISEGLSNRIGGALAFVNFSDVRATGETGDGGGVVRTVVETFDGLLLTLLIDVDDGGGWVRARAEHTDSPEEAEALNERFAGFEFRLPASTIESLTRRRSDLLEEVAPEAGPALPGDDVPELLRPPGD